MRIILQFILLVVFTQISSQNIRVGVLYDKDIKSIIFSPGESNYTLFGDSIEFFSFNKNNAVLIKAEKDSIRVMSYDGSTFLFSEIQFVSRDNEAYFRLKSVQPALDIKLFNDNLTIRNRWGRLSVINEVDMTDYLCGVIEKEAGTYAHPEYYKVQAILCRTYWAKAKENHVLEGFDLCDGVHCQAFKGKHGNVKKIVDAVNSTADIIITDTSGVPITAVFHSNCGGQTQAAEHVWSRSRPYLQTINDEFCTAMPMATWKKVIPLNDWIDYLRTNNFHLDLPQLPGCLQFAQPSRLAYYKVGNDSINLVKIRTDFKLRSTFFSVTVVGNEVILNGKGYGHGVGLCQEGAMQMAKKGYLYPQILNKYFKNISLNSLKVYLSKKSEISQ